MNGDIQYSAAFGTYQNGRWENFRSIHGTWKKEAVVAPIESSNTWAKTKQIALRMFAGCLGAGLPWAIFAAVQKGSSVLSRSIVFSVAGGVAASLTAGSALEASLHGALFGAMSVIAQPIVGDTVKTACHTAADRIDQIWSRFSASTQSAYEWMGSIFTNFPDRGFCKNPSNPFMK